MRPCARHFHPSVKTLIFDRFKFQISSLARNGVHEYYLLLAARNLGQRVVAWGKRPVFRSLKSRQPDCSDEFVP